MAEAEAAHAVSQGAGLEGQEAPEDKKSVACHRTVQVLFERCLIACAFYEEFWDKVRRTKLSTSGSCPKEFVSVWHFDLL